VPRSSGATARIKAEVTVVLRTNEKMTNLDFWINLAMNAEDEAEVYDKISKQWR